LRTAIDGVIKIWQMRSDPDTVMQQYTAAAQNCLANRNPLKVLKEDIEVDAQPAYIWYSNLLQPVMPCILIGLRGCVNQDIIRHNRYPALLFYVL